MRVPGWARTCIRICPESTAGKKFSPRNGQRPNESTTHARKPPMKVFGRPSASDNSAR